MTKYYNRIKKILEIGFHLFVLFFFFFFYCLIILPVYISWFQSEKKMPRSYLKYTIENK